MNYLPEDIEAEMNFVERTATIALNAVAGFAAVIAKIDKLNSLIHLSQKRSQRRSPG